jgi:small GTP-binding protein
LVGRRAINLLDTPGHPDFIAEVERVLSVLDGVVLVISAIEGVQPQTRVLMRALQRLRLPVLLFVNKIDRSGADPERVLRAIAQRLTPAHRGELADQLAQVVAEEAKLTTAARRLEIKKALYPFGVDTQGGEDASPW